MKHEWRELEASGLAGEAAGVAKLATNPRVRGSTPARLEFVLEEEIVDWNVLEKIVLSWIEIERNDFDFLA